MDACECRSSARCLDCIERDGLTAAADSDTCPRCYGKGLEGQDERPGLLLDIERGTDECRACGGTGRR